jgi:hypothetical protein
VSIARVRAMIVVGVLVLLAAVAAGWAIAQDHQTGAAVTGARCIGKTVPFVTEIPANPATIAVNVYNTTSQLGLATRVSDELSALGFGVAQVGNDPMKATVRAVAEIRYGPAGAGAAQLVRSWFPGAETRLVSRPGAEVDVALGMLYERVAAPAEATAERERLGAPTPPPEYC